jgi:peptide/nickel transport system substrate-binding protein
MRIRHLTLASIGALLITGSVALAQTRLVVATVAEASGLDPRLVTDVYSYQRIYTMMEPLIVFEKDLGYRPRLATDWSFSEDGSVITFNLRAGVTFHHGEPFTAEDVKYTIDWVRDEDNPSLIRNLYVNISDVEVVDDLTVRITVDPTYVWVMNALARLHILPADIGDTNDWNTNPIGTGPFRFVEWLRDDRMVVEAFEDYWGERGNVDQVVFRPITEDGTRLLSFEAGELDLFHGQVTPGEVPRLEDTPGITVTRATGLGHAYLGFNFRNELLARTEVRHALAHLIPSEAIVARVLNGIGTVGVGPISPESIYFAEDIPRYPHDPERARELLVEAGLEDGFSVRLHTNENPVRIQIAEILQFEAARVGIDIDVTVEEFGAFIDRILGPDADFDIYILGWSGNVDPDYATYGLFKTGGDNNYIGYGNPEVDALLELGRMLPPGSPESIATYQEIQRLLMTDVPFAFINNTEEIGVVHDWIDGWSVHPYASATFQDLHLVTKER